jgi:hypothetical protein
MSCAQQARQRLGVRAAVAAAFGWLGCWADASCSRYKLKIAIFEGKEGGV